MTLPEFVELLTAALYNETLVRGRSQFTIREIVDAYTLNWKIHWADNIVHDIQKRNFARVYDLGGDVLDDLFSIGAGGVHWIETHLEENLATYLEQHGAVYQGQIVEVETGALDSALWTGLPSDRIVPQAKREELISLLVKAERDLEFVHATNSEKALARAYIVAARTLAESPEPPEDLIWELISRANNIAGIASLLISVVALVIAGRG